MNLHHFYHVYADGNCEQPMREHIRALKESGLYEALTTFKIGFVGLHQKIEEALVCLNSLGVVFDVAARSPDGWEQVTQIPMHAFSKENDGLILYAHSKGSFTQSEVNNRWRRSMIWHNVWKWRYAVERLKDHKAYGCHWIQPLISGMPEHRQGNWMMAGTFYWTHCELMRTWMVPPLTHRFEAEGWIGYGYAEAPFPVWDCTPYFPNTDTFMDDWVTFDPLTYNPTDRGKSYPPVPTVNVLP